MKNLISANQKGFTLVELLITIAIVGILAAIIVPRFLQGEAARASEALSQLAAIRLGEEDYRTNNGIYCGTDDACWTDWSTITMDNPGSSPERFFDYDVTTNDVDSFCIVATRGDFNPSGNAFAGTTICMDNFGSYFGDHPKGPGFGHSPGSGTGCEGVC
ncbi:MAG: hypothetical protein COV74_08410 [Candidatus Omnitrophica bacterium CG11_big_fil_rev_8_21_14_0_20_45_26]|uniref:Prepilin-type N-terminal cleavage/methylation domain-containing protein n=1 Tax=Candidatus Abzuiibacterium crystallinum TaxID=1974748 RepID=A0A2H0LM39_9BACT|nr:MAG: hypothetical protein COV74_08410 [Candidatus Omnitrophica bacterium CG11_big_fil_rev_8_21_14_0_20_45_26]